MRIAIWLLTRVGVDEAMVGDLLEQRHAGRSRAWLGCQVAGAVISVLVRDMAAHPLRATIGALLALGMRSLTIRMWGPHEMSVDGAVGGALLDAVSLGRPAYLIALSWVNALVLAPAWLATGFALARVSRAAAPLFVTLALAFVLPGVVRQLHYAVASEMARWLVPVQLTMFASSVAIFVCSTFVGSAWGTSRGDGLSHPAD